MSLTPLTVLENADTHATYFHAQLRHILYIHLWIITTFLYLYMMYVYINISIAIKLKCKFSSKLEVKALLIMSSIAYLRTGKLNEMNEFTF